MMAAIGRLFIKGFLALLPVVLTVYVLVWLGERGEKLIGGILAWLLPEGWYVPGMGLAAAAGLILLFGLLLEAYVFRWLFGLAERLMEKLPLVRSVYRSLRDITDFIRMASDKHRLNQVVVAELAPGVRLLGFLTREDVNGSLPEAFRAEGDGPEQPAETVAVYLPMSYQVGGFTVFLPRSAVHPVEGMSTSEALRLALTAGLTAQDDASAQGSAAPGRRGPADGDAGEA